MCLCVCLFKALLKKWDNLLRKLFQTFSKNKELLKRFGTFEKMGKFLKKTVSNYEKRTVSKEFGRSGGGGKGERSELPRASAASCHG